MTFRPGPKTLWGYAPHAGVAQMSKHPATVGQSRHRTSDGPAATISTAQGVVSSWRLSKLILFFIVAVVLLYGVIYPNLHVVLQSLQRGGSWSLQNYREIFAQRIVLKAIFSSVSISILTVLFCAAIGIPLAFLFERFAFPARRLFATLAALPLVLPPLEGTVSFIFLFSESGILARLAQ